MIGTSTNTNLNTSFDLQKCPASHYIVNQLVKYTKVDTRINPIYRNNIKNTIYLNLRRVHSHMYNILEGSR